MTRNQLAHVLRTVARISGDRDILVIGSQSILGSYPEDALPLEATGSMEVDTAFFGDPDGAKADVVDVNLGEFSEFHDEFGYYPQGVSVTTGVFPEGWRDRLVAFEGPGTEPGRGLCLEPHDCILAKLVRFDEKDVRFAYALVRAGLIDLDTLDSRAGTLPAHPAVVDRIRTWIRGMRVRLPHRPDPQPARADRRIRVSHLCPNFSGQRAPIIGFAPPGDGCTTRLRS